MPLDCVFCKIASGEIPSSKVYEDEQVLAFDDISPQAPVHVLVIPKKHLASIADLRASETALLGQLLTAIQKVAELKGISETGYRVITNAGRDSGQEVFHLHFHVMGGKQLGPLG